jgi:hypothetical protein
VTAHRHGTSGVQVAVVIIMISLAAYLGFVNLGLPAQAQNGASSNAPNQSGNAVTISANGPPGTNIHTSSTTRSIGTTTYNSGIAFGAPPTTTFTSLPGTSTTYGTPTSTSTSANPTTVTSTTIDPSETTTSTTSQSTSTLVTTQTATTTSTTTYANTTTTTTQPTTSSSTSSSTTTTTTTLPSTSTFTSTNTTTTTTTKAPKLLWSWNFESGTQWSDGGPLPSLVCGNSPGAVVTSPVHSGKYAGYYEFPSYSGQNACASFPSWDIADNPLTVSDTYWEVWVYLPSQTLHNQWVVLSNPFFDGWTHMVAVWIDSNRRLNLGDDLIGSSSRTIYQSGPNYVTVDFNAWTKIGIAIHVRPVGQDSQIVLYKDGVMVINDTYPSAFSTYPTITGAHWGAYSGGGGGLQIYNDDIAIYDLTGTSGCSICTISKASATAPAYDGYLMLPIGAVGLTTVSINSVRVMGCEVDVSTLSSIFRGARSRFRFVLNRILSTTR